MTATADLDPKLVSLILMAETAQAAHDLALAEHCYRLALERDPTQPAALLNLGVSLVKQRRFEEALVELGHLEKAVPMRGQGWEVVQLRLSGHYNAAIAHWQLAMEGPDTDAERLARALALARRLAVWSTRAVGRSRLGHERRQALGRLQGGAMTLTAGVLVDALVAHVPPEAVPGRYAVPRRPRRRRPSVWMSSRLRWPPAWLVTLTGDDWYDMRTVTLLCDAARREHGKDARTRYNLAVVGSRLLARRLADPGAGGDGDDPRTIARRALDDLEDALHREPSRLAWTRGDVLLSPLFTADTRRYQEVVPPPEAGGVA